LKTKFIARTIAIAGLLSMTAIAHAQQAQPADRVYAIDVRNEVARSGTGLCWRTGFWTPAAAASDPAGCGCDKDLLPKEKCEPAQTAAAPAPAAATPAKPAAPKKCDFALTLKDDQTFSYDKANLSATAKAALDKDVLARMASCAQVNMVVVTGHTDRIGSHQYNQELSEKRAEAVKSYLVSKGVPGDRIETMGAGKTQPASGAARCADNLSRKQLIQCLAPHRRTEVEVRGPAK
jgi:OOP family OmpA-OmpF porin